MGDINVHQQTGAFSVEVRKSAANEFIMDFSFAHNCSDYSTGLPYDEIHVTSSVNQGLLLIEALVKGLSQIIPGPRLACKNYYLSNIMLLTIRAQGTICENPLKWMLTTISEQFYRAIIIVARLLQFLADTVHRANAITHASASASASASALHLAKNV